MSNLTTKERILESALTLFSERGFDGVGVDLIASMAGIKGPSLYRHFKSKDEILQTIVEQSEVHYERGLAIQLTKGNAPQSLEELVQSSLSRIRFTMHDEMIKKVRRICMMEQFRNESVASLTTAHHLNRMNALYKSILSDMMDKGLIIRDNPELLALELTAPATLLLHMVDREPHREEEAMHRIEEHLRHFVKVYGVSQKEL